MTRQRLGIATAALATAALFAAPGDVQAQRVGRGYARGAFGAGSYGGYGNRFYGYPGYYSGYGNRLYGYTGYPGSGFGYGFGNQNYGSSYYSPGYSYSYPLMDGSYYASPGVVAQGWNTGNTVAGVVQPGLSQSMYTPSMAMPGATSAQVTITLPVADAQLWFEGVETSQGMSMGTVRQFTSPPLQPGQSYHYTIRARWQQNGQTMDQTRKANVAAGLTTNVDFTRPESADGTTSGTTSTDPTTTNLNRPAGVDQPDRTVPPQPDGSGTQGDPSRRPGG